MALSPFPDKDLSFKPPDTCCRTATGRLFFFLFLSPSLSFRHLSLSLSLSLCFASLVKYFSRVWASFVSPSCCLKYPERGSDRENDGGEGAKIGSVSKQISFSFEGNPLMYFTPCLGLFNTLKLLFYDPLIINGFIKQIKSYRTQTVFISFCGTVRALETQFHVLLPETVTDFPSAVIVRS